MHVHYWQHYTSTIKVPVYASWKCENCQEVNFATGQIICKRTEGNTSWFPSDIRAAQKLASERTHSEWLSIATKIIVYPNHNGSTMYKHFFLHNSKCTKCRKKPWWNKGPKLLPLVAVSIPVSIISGISAVLNLMSVTPWLVFLASIGVIIWAIGRKLAYPKKMLQLPKEYTPVIGSFNPSLITVATGIDKTMPTPDECIAAVRGYNQKTEEVQPVASVENRGFAPVNYCRQCGTKLKANMIFCHKCRAEITKK